VFFSNYTSEGYQLSAIQIQANDSGKEVQSIALKANLLAENLAAQEKGVPEFSNTDSVVYKTKKYSKLGHLFNFHSWAPAYIDVNNYEMRPGFSLFSQNKLGTAETKLGYDYNVADRTGRYKLGFNYSGWFPEINTEITMGNQAENYNQIINTVNSNHEIISSDTTVQRLKWREITADINVRLPLNLSKGKFSRMLYPEVSYSLKNISGTDSSLIELYPGNYHALTYRIYFYNLLHQSDQNLIPKWGQQIDLIFSHTPFIGSDLGTLAGIQTVLYFPGLFRNDGVQIYQGYQEMSFANATSFSDFIRFPRGFQSFQNNKMYSLAADYKFPIIYPDLSIGKLAYIKRVKTSLFYDYAWLSVPKIEDHVLFPNDHTMKMKSIGVDLTSDLHVLRFFAPIEIGFRTVYRPDPEFRDFQFNLLLAINFNGL
jgi:hypothetical protein